MAVLMLLTRESKCVTLVSSNIISALRRRFHWPHVALCEAAFLRAFLWEGEDYDSRFKAQASADIRLLVCHLGDAHAPADGHPHSGGRQHHLDADFGGC